MSPNDAKTRELTDSPSSIELGDVSEDFIECFRNPHPDLHEHIEHEVFEFSHLCPFTGHPDYAVLRIRYTPDEFCIELRALKLYLQQFREVGISYEQLVGHLAKVLFRHMRPRRLIVAGEWNGRGGIRSRLSVTLPDDAPCDSGRAWSES